MSTQADARSPLPNLRPCPSRSVTPEDPQRLGGRSFSPVRDWIWFVVTGWLEVGNTGFQESFADVLHFRLLGIVQGVDK